MLLGLVPGAATNFAAAASLDNSAQQRIRAATFEVVQRKPDEGAIISYDRPLPMELVPYQERRDKYRSVGIAFAIGANRYVSAGHVLALGMGSRYGPPALRDARSRGLRRVLDAHRAQGRAATRARTHTGGQ